MPHFGKLKAIVETINKDGDVKRLQNSFTSSPDVVADFDQSPSLGALFSEIAALRQLVAAGSGPSVAADFNQGTML